MEALIFRVWPMHNNNKLHLNYIYVTFMLHIWHLDRIWVSDAHVTWDLGLGFTHEHVTWDLYVYFNDL